MTSDKIKVAVRVRPFNRRGEGQFISYFFFFSPLIYYHVIQIRHLLIKTILHDFHLVKISRAWRCVMLPSWFADLFLQKKKKRKKMSAILCFNLDCPYKKNLFYFISDVMLIKSLFRIMTCFVTRKCFVYSSSCNDISNKFFWNPMWKVKTRELCEKKLSAILIIFIVLDSLNAFFKYPMHWHFILLTHQHFKKNF